MWFKFTLFANNFNIEKGKFVSFFYPHRKGHVEILENTLCNRSILREQKYRQRNAGKKLVEILVENCLSSFFHVMTEMREPGKVQEVVPLLHHQTACKVNR